MQGTALGTLLSARSGWLQARYTVLAQNVANADTPHFVPQDLPEPDFDRLLADSARSAGTPGSISAGPLAMARTAFDHLQAARQGVAHLGRPRPMEGVERSPSGNGVVLEEQAQLLDRTRLQHELTTGIYRKMVGLMRTAIGGGA
ncbi:MAG: hypothetical protein KDE35_11455 [Geminicoccaceae bacterium]|nr:hypothetical protein [Geminicoccaceae bacterium]